MNNKTWFRVLLLMLIAVFATACASSSQNSSYSGADANFEKSITSIMPEDGFDVAAEITYEEKRIKTGNIVMETGDFNNVVDSIKSTAINEGGYVESYNSYIYNTSGGKDLKSGDLVIRIPSDSFASVLEQIKSLAKVKSASESDESATEKYYDIQARMTTKLTEEERLLALLEKAESIEDLISLEQRLSEIRGDIELFQSQMNQIDRKSQYATILVNLIEIEGGVTINPVSDDFFEKIANSFKASINATLEFFENALIFIAGMIVPLFGICTAGFIVWGVSVLIRKRKNRKK